MKPNIEPTELKTEQEFLNALKLDCAIIYFFIEWSVPERTSGNIISKALSNIDLQGTPVYKIDCSDQTKQ